MFHIFDFFLTDELGHFYEYDISLIKELQSRNIKTKLYVPLLSSILVLQNIKTTPLFRSLSKHYGITKFLPSFLGNVLSSLYENIIIFINLKSLDNNAFSKEESIFFPTINHRQILSVIWWFLRIPKDQSPRLILLFHFEENPSQRNCIFCPRIIYRIGFFILEKYHNLNIIIATDSDELAHDYQLMTKRKVKTFPIPHIKESQTHPKRIRSEPVISYLGEARVEKGFHLLPEAIEQVLSSKERLRSFPLFFVQGVSHKQNDEGLVQKAQEKLKSLAKIHNNIKITERSLTGEEYHGFLSNADILLLPYSQKAYRSRTSGIFAEGMGQGKLMIIPEMTWMYKQILNFKGIAMSFEDGNPASLADAIVRSINYFDEMDCDILTSSSKKWNAFHNPQKLVDMLMDCD